MNMWTWALKDQLNTTEPVETLPVSSALRAQGGGLRRKFKELLGDETAASAEIGMGADELDNYRT